MNVLVVDDLKEVVQSLLEGVNWASLGIDRVFGASGVEEAEAILSANDVALMLCDIEMPPHSGFELLEWVRAKGMDTECIFLTSHAEFSYAQQAVRLGSFDYLLQPARRSDIEAAVRKAMERIRSKKNERDAAQNGEYWQKRCQMLGEACVHRFLRENGGDASEFLEDLSRLGIHISPSDGMCVLLFQPHRTCSQLEEESLRELVARELDRTGRTMMVVNITERALLVLLFGGDAGWGETAAKMEALLDQWHGRIGGPKPACYMSGEIRPHELSREWQRLKSRMDNNVASYGGVFVTAQTEEIPHYTYVFPDMKRWARQLEQGSGAQVEEEALQFLNEQREKGMLDAEFLAKFHQNFVQMISSVAEVFRLKTHSLFYEDYPFQDFLQAYTSYEKMVDLIRFAVQSLQGNAAAPETKASPVEQAIDYIRANIERDLHRGEIAEKIFMNEDHLSRLFKKETGVSMHDFIVQEKMRRAASLLVSTNLSVSIIASKVGYPNFSYFTQAFKKETGLTPGDYRQEHKKN